MSLAAALLCALVVCWLAVTTLAQMRRFQPLINSLDGFHLIPRWTFFAPNPGTRDYHLVARERLTDGRTTAWKSVPVYEPRPRLAYFWHPQKRAPKILNDAVQSVRFLMNQGEVGASGLPFTMPYLLLLRHAMRALAPESQSAELQFAIIDSTGHSDRQLECAYVSSFHPR
jgi:hypothetical protein